MPVANETHFYAYDSNLGLAVFFCFPIQAFRYLLKNIIKQRSKQFLMNFDTTTRLYFCK